MSVARKSTAEELINRAQRTAGGLTIGPPHSRKQALQTLVKITREMDQALERAWRYLEQTDSDEQYARFLNLLQGYQWACDTARKNGATLP